MEKLIKLQALISQIENFTMNEKKYHSSFHYNDDKTLVIKTFCKEQTIKIMMMFDRANDLYFYFEDNNTIKVVSLEYLNREQ